MDDYESIPLEPIKKVRVNYRRVGSLSPVPYPLENDNVRDRLIRALMTAEEYTYEQAERIVDAYERELVCPRCGSVVSDQLLENTIWANQDY